MGSSKIMRHLLCHCYLCREGCVKHSYLRCGSCSCTLSTSNVIPCLWTLLASSYIQSFLTVCKKSFKNSCLCSFFFRIIQLCVASHTFVVIQHVYWQIGTYQLVHFAPRSSPQKSIWVKLQLQNVCLKPSSKCTLPENFLATGGCFECNTNCVTANTNCVTAQGWLKKERRKKKKERNFDLF